MRVVACLLLAACTVDGGPIVRPDLSTAPHDGALVPLDLASLNSADLSVADLAMAMADQAMPAGDLSLACVSTWGTGMTAAFGRLDGTLVSVDKQTDLACPHDNNHVILEVRMGGAVYELWVNSGTDVDHMSTLEKTAPLGAPAWAEGWHPGAVLDYVTTFGLSSASFVDTAPVDVANQLAGELTPGQPISVYTTGYGPDGGHDIHRQATNQDGAVVVNPTTNPRYLLYRFSTQTF